MKKRVSSIFGGTLRIVSLMVTDLLCIYGVWVALVWGLRALGITQYRYGEEFYLRLWPIGPAFVGINALFRLYHGRLLCPAAPLSPIEELRRLMGSAFITHVGALAVIVMLLQTSREYSRLLFFLSGAAVAALAQPMRDLVRALLFKLDLGQIPVVLIGSGSAAERALSALSGNRYVGFRVVRRFNPADADMVHVSRKLGVRILVACVDQRLFRCRLREFTEWFTCIEYLPTAEVFPVFGSKTVSFDGMGGIEMVNQSRMLTLQIQKWMLDKVLSIIAFVLLLPFFLLVPALVKLTSPGPVFYRQRRLGRKGREISIWKFRSMYMDADERLKRILAEDPAAAKEWKESFKLHDDPRVTPLGRFLRKTSIDEFPQLFNVLSGDMALVGPRPIVKDEVAYYGTAYKVFASVKPGITGLWQVSGRSDTNYARRVALDTEYVINWSPWLDIWILIRTVFTVLTSRGAC